MTDWIQVAREIGFDEAAILRIDTLKPMQAVRDMCAADKCKAYGKNWTCPPECDTLEQCEGQMQSYRQGILVQTVGKLERTIDTKGYAQAALRHRELFRAFTDLVRKVYPDALCLGAGVCDLCGQCAYPEPCRFPDKRIYAMEGYGLFVTQVCKDNQIPYYHGAKTIAYSACVLFDKKDGKTDV